MDSADLAFFHAIVSDPEHVKRLDALSAEQKKLDDAKEDIRVASEKANSVLTEAQTERRQAEAIRADVAAREQKLAADTETLGGVIASFNAEKVAWEAVRQKVDANHAAHSASLREREAAVAMMLSAQGAKQAELDQREKAVAEREALHERRAIALRSALEVA